MNILNQILDENVVEEEETWYQPPTMVKDGEVHGVISGVGGKLHRELPGGFETKFYHSIKEKYMGNGNSFVSEVFVEGIIQYAKDKVKGGVNRITSQFKPKNMGNYALRRAGQVGGSTLIKHIEKKKAEE